MLRVGSMVFAENDDAVIDGVVVAIKGERALVSDNPFCGVMVLDFGITLEYVRSISRCRWFNLSECVLDDEGDDDE